MAIRGVRGATVATENTREAIVEDVASAFFSTTRDLNAEFPAIAARRLGWTDAALMCFHEMEVPHGLPRCVRILAHWNTDRPASAIVHVYIRGAEALRPDRIKQG